MLIKGREKVGNEILKNPEVLTDYSQKIDDIYNQTKERRVLIVLDDKIWNLNKN